MEMKMVLMVMWIVMMKTITFILVPMKYVIMVWMIIVMDGMLNVQFLAAPIRLL